MVATVKINLSELSPELWYRRVLEIFGKMKIGEVLQVMLDHEPISLMRYLKSKLGFLGTYETKEESPELWKLYVLKRGEEKEAKTLVEIVNKNWLASEILERYGINYWSEGEKELETACKEKKLDVNHLKKEIKGLHSENIYFDFDLWGINYIMDYLVDCRYLFSEEKLRKILNLISKATLTDGSSHPEIILNREKIVQITGHFFDNVEMEKVLFPIIKNLLKIDENKWPTSEISLNQTLGLIDALIKENKEICNEMNRLKNLNHDFKPRIFSSSTIKELYSHLQEMESKLHQYIHLENNILFTKTLSLLHKLFRSEEESQASMQENLILF